MIAMGIQALWRQRSKAKERLLTRGKAFFPTVPFLYHRRREGLADALARSCPRGRARGSTGEAWGRNAAQVRSWGAT
jgi:hypothetical protein